MRAHLVRFGEIEVDGERYEHDVVVEAGRVRKRRKGPSKDRRTEFGHTPLTAAEEIPWGARGTRLIVGTGADGMLPVAHDVRAEATRRGVELVEVPTEAACDLIADMNDGEVRAVLHVTC